MKATNTRRNFIRDTSLTATGLFFVSVSGSSHQALKELSIGCAPAKATLLFGSIGSVKTGSWSDPATWGGRIPSATDTILVNSGHTITYDLVSTKVAGVNINAGGTLQFDASKSTLLQTTKNVVVEGNLVMLPSNEKVVQTLRFVEVNENNFIGGGMVVKDTDTGLWVMGAGKLNLEGAAKQSWTYLTGSVSRGTTSVNVKNATSWQVGDEIFICPTRTPAANSMDYDDSRGPVDSFAPEFERRIITAISGNTISFTDPLKYDHLQVVTDSGKTWTAEVGNLSRNVKVEGTVTGKVHTFLMTSSVQTIKNVAFRYMGPRKNQISRRGDMIAGRYAIHFHHCGNAVANSQVTGCVVSECGNHAYVPHVSHGINMSNNIAFNCLEMSFWWDFGDMSHNTIWNNNLIALNTFIYGTADMVGLESTVSFNSGGMYLGKGDGNIAKGNTIVYGGVGEAHGKGGFVWEANNEGIWDFENNVAHSNHIGIRVWQNTVRNHTIINMECYNNIVHLFHGAYANAYTYRGGIFYNGETHVKASSANSAKMQFEKVTFDAAGNFNNAVQIEGSPIPNSEHPNIFRQCTFKNYKSSAVHIYTPGPATGDLHYKCVDLIHCTFTGKEHSFEAVSEAYSTVRLQNQSNQSKKFRWDGGIADITPFGPALWGDGMGLKAEYYNDAALGNKVLERTDSVLMFSEWSGDRDSYKLPLGVHHKITGYSHSVRWTGKIRAQYSEAYVLRLRGSGGFRMWLDGKLIIDKWVDYRDADFATSPIAMVAGAYYDVKIEYFNLDAFSGALLFWKCPSMEKEILIPQSQLYSVPASGTDTTTEAANKGPVANAGSDITLTLPINNTVLDGSGSNDPDGKIISYKWTKISGPTQFTLSNDVIVNPTLSNLVAGTYTFRLEVKDDKNVVATDDVVIVLNEVAANKGPVANAGPDVTLTLPTNSTTLNGASSSDPDGKIVSYLWTKTNGPTQFAITSPNSVTSALTNLVLGTYTFRLQVTDDKGAVAIDDVVITVQDGINKGPLANAGADITLTLPTNTATVNGLLSNDPDGTIASFNWTKVSGPIQYGISDPNAATTTINNLVEGIYTFRLKVTDNKGATATDDIIITVKPNLASSQPQDQTQTFKSLTVTFGPNPSISNFKVNVKSTRKYPIGICVYNQWWKEVAIYKNVGNGSTTIMGDNWKPGTYYILVGQNEEEVRLTLLKLPS